MSLLGCHDVCPKHLPLSTQLAFIRRKDGFDRMEMKRR
jgi:fumarate reductase iron-sulfur subunit